MSYNWIKPEEISFNCILLMDRWLIRYICESLSNDDEYNQNLGLALSKNPVVLW